MFTQIGNRLPAHSTGSGKVMLAYSPPEVVEGVLRRYGLPERTAHTIVDVDAFRRELDRIRSQGYAVDDEELEEGVRCVAAAVRDESGQVVASLSISGPVTRMGDRQVQDIIPEVMDCGRKLSARLGFKTEPAPVS
jgi:IclR family acetate operon transcriptional repressor